jgi:hydrogenase-4 component H
MKLLLSKIKQAILCLLAGRATLPYPAEPHDPEGEFRGYPSIDVDKCIGCAACASVCPARLIRVTDLDQTTRHITRLLERCIYCGRCAEVCPEDAISMTKKYELSSDQARTDLTHDCEVFMATCRRCGRCYEPKTPLDRIMQPGFRSDELDRGGSECPYANVTDECPVEDEEQEAEAPAQ